MNSFSSGSSSSRSVCGLGTLTSAIRSSFARSREMRASSSFLMSAASMGVFRFELSRLAWDRAPVSRHLGAAEAQASLHARPQHEHETEREDAGGQRPQDEYRVVVVRDHQGLVERAFRELAENEPDDQT